MKEWIIAQWTGIVAGFVIGWIVFKRPQWATDLFNKIKSKIPGLH